MSTGRITPSGKRRSSVSLAVVADLHVREARRLESHVQAVVGPVVAVGGVRADRARVLRDRGAAGDGRIGGDRAVAAHEERHELRSVVLLLILVPPALD